MHSLKYSIEEAIAKTIHVILDKIPEPQHQILRKYLLEDPKLEWLLYPFSGTKNNRYNLEIKETR